MTDAPLIYRAALARMCFCVLDNLGAQVRRFSSSCGKYDGKNSDSEFFSLGQYAQRKIPNLNFFGTSTGSKAKNSDSEFFSAAGFLRRKIQNLNFFGAAALLQEEIQNLNFFAEIPRSVDFDQELLGPDYWTSNPTTMTELKM